MTIEGLIVRRSRIAIGVLASLVFLLPLPCLLAQEVAQQQVAPSQSDPVSQGNKESKSDHDKSGRKWIRLLTDSEGQPIAMQTSIVRYTSKDDEQLAVDLIGAVHVGDKAYYLDLNRRFKGYDALLYELVAPKGTKVKRGSGTSSGHPIGAMQNGMKNMLGLEHQLTHIDYGAKNFVHADMSPDQFAKAMKDRNESFLQMFFRMMGQSMALQSKQQASGGSSDLDLLLALFDSNRELKLKRVMAKQLISSESMLTNFGGPEGTTIIQGRNAIAMQVLQKERTAGKKKIGVFYGAAHLADMDKYLREEKGLIPQQTVWLTAWDLSDPK